MLLTAFVSRLINPKAKSPRITHLIMKILVNFKKKLTVTFTSEANERECYKLSYAELDTGLRKYLRKYVSAEDKILAIKQAHN